jgi:microcystin-dependent protein
MAFNSKDDAKDNMNSNITTPIEPHLTPVGTTNRVRATNLKNWINEFLDWVFPNTVVSLKGKSPIVTATNMDYGSISWIEIVPIGTIMPWAGASSSPPDGYLFCDGSTVSDTTYAELFGVIGSNYGSAPSGQFKLPNLEGRVPLGFDSGSSTSPNSSPSPTQSNYGKVGNTGGIRNVSLNTNEIPSHRHSKGNLKSISSNDSKHTHRVAGWTINYDGGGNVVEALTYAGGENHPGKLTGNPHGTKEGAHSHDISGYTSYTGGGSAHENRMPYVVMKYIIKT